MKDHIVGRLTTWQVVDSSISSSWPVARPRSRTGRQLFVFFYYSLWLYHTWDQKKSPHGPPTTKKHPYGFVSSVSGKRASVQWAWPWSAGSSTKEVLHNVCDKHSVESRQRDQTQLFCGKIQKWLINPTFQRQWQAKKKYLVQLRGILG